MLDGKQGPAVQKAMDLLVRYADALGAEDFVETNNVAQRRKRVGTETALSTAVRP